MEDATILATTRQAKHVASLLRLTAHSIELWLGGLRLAVGQVDARVDAAIGRMIGGAAELRTAARQMEVDL
jgi:hypothetical protein